MGADHIYEGLYYSTDSGATWHLSTITDGSGGSVQGPLSPAGSHRGNAATAVVWNPVRQLFVAAVRYHGYYQSSDGVTWTRMSAQPGTRAHRAKLSQQFRADWLDCMSNLSRCAGGQSANRRHVCVDRRPERSGPGLVAGSMRDQQRDLQQSGHHLRHPVEHCAA